MNVADRNPYGLYSLRFWANRLIYFNQTLEREARAARERMLANQIYSYRRKTK